MRTFENAIDIPGSAAEVVAQIGPVGHEPPVGHMQPVLVDGREAMLRRKLREALAVEEEHEVEGHENRIAAPKRCESLLKLPGTARPGARGVPPEVPGRLLSVSARRRGSGIGGIVEPAQPARWMSEQLGQKLEPLAP